MERKHKFADDLQFVFVRGDQVWLKSRAQNKLEHDACGPFTFVKYKSLSKLTALICGNNKRERLVTVANLLPVHRNTKSVHKVAERPE